MKIKCVVCVGPGLRYDAVADEELGLAVNEEVVVAFDKHDDCGSVLRMAPSGDATCDGNDCGQACNRGGGAAPVPARSAARLHGR